MSVLNVLKDMKSRRIKILFILLALAAIAAAVLVHPKRFHVDRTEYSMTRLTDPNGMPIRIKAMTRSGNMIAWSEVPRSLTRTIERGEYDRFLPYSPQIFRIDRQGHVEPISFSREYVIHPHGTNDSGWIVGTAYDPNKIPSAFCWDSQQGFRLLPIGGTLTSFQSYAEVVNNQGLIAGCWANQSPLSQRVFLYDSAAGFTDLGTVGMMNMYLEGINEEGIIIGEAMPPTMRGTHAFYGSRQEGLVDIHSKITSLLNSSAKAISDSGWILIQANNNSKDGEVVWYHPQKGKGPSFSWTYRIASAYPIPSTDRFAVIAFSDSWEILGRTIRSSQVSNWILEPGQKPVLLSPKILAEKYWTIFGVDDQGTIYGNIVDNNPAKKLYYYFVQGVLLRPAQPAAPAGK